MVKYCAVCERKIVVLSRLKSGKKLVGINQCLKAVKNGSALTVFLAEDAENRIKLSLSELCRTQNVEVVSVSTMKELGEACGIEVGAAAAVLLK